MKLSISKNKNGTSNLYISKSFRKQNGKSSTKVVKKLGKLEDLMAKRNETKEQVLDYARNIAKEMTEKENQDNLKLNLILDPNKDIVDKNVLEFGYVHLKKIFHELNLDKTIEKISSKYKFEYDLDDIFQKLIYSRILDPSSKRSTYAFSKNFLEKPKFELHDLYRALSVLGQETELIQKELYENSKNIVKRNTRVFYYDCTNFFFEINSEDNLRKYGISKENRPNPIVQMGLLMDGNGYPISFDLTPGNTNEQTTLKPIEKKIISKYSLSEFVICTDTGLSSNANRKFNDMKNRKFITTQSVKKIKNFLKDYILDAEGWCCNKFPNRTFDLSKVDSKKYFDCTFYKSRWIKENGVEQRLIVSFSFKYMQHQRDIRNSQINRAIKNINNNRVEKKNPNDPNRLISSRYITSDGELASKVKRTIDIKKIEEEQKYDGFYAICTNLEDNVENIIAANKKRWQIENCFRILKSEFKARPVFVSLEENIKAHFLVCFVSLMFVKILKAKTNNKYSTHQIIEDLKSIKLLEREAFGYEPIFKTTPIINDLNNVFDTPINKEIISKKNIKIMLKK